MNRPSALLWHTREPVLLLESSRTESMQEVNVLRFQLTSLPPLNGRLFLTLGTAMVGINDDGEDGLQGVLYTHVPTSIAAGYFVSLNISPSFPCRFVQSPSVSSRLRFRRIGESLGTPRFAPCDPGPGGKSRCKCHFGSWASLPCPERCTQTPRRPFEAPAKVLCPAVQHSRERDMSGSLSYDTSGAWMGVQGDADNGGAHPDLANDAPLNLGASRGLRRRSCNREGR